MSPRIAASLTRTVRQRAKERCEYCQLPQDCQEATFHIDHIVPEILGGQGIVENLALACVSCSLRKAARVQARDPQSGMLAQIYHPRMNSWADHFRWTAGWKIIGKTPTGRATIAALRMNRPSIVGIRQLLAAVGRM